MTNVFVSKSGNEGDWIRVEDYPNKTEIDGVAATQIHLESGQEGRPGHSVQLFSLDKVQEGEPQTYSTASGLIREGGRGSVVVFDGGFLRGREVRLYAKHEAVSRGKERA